jgi:hypothetical protein
LPADTAQRTEQPRGNNQHIELKNKPRVRIKIAAQTLRVSAQAILLHLSIRISTKRCQIHFEKSNEIIVREMKILSSARQRMLMRQRYTTARKAKSQECSVIPFCNPMAAASVIALPSPAIFSRRDKTRRAAGNAPRLLRRAPGVILAA